VILESIATVLSRVTPWHNEQGPDIYAVAGSTPDQTLLCILRQVVHIFTHCNDLLTYCLHLELLTYLWLRSSPVTTIVTSLERRLKLLKVRILMRQM